MKFASKIFTLIFFLIILTVFIYRYRDYVVRGNFLLEVNTKCDGLRGTCFAPSKDLGFVEGPYEKVEIIKKFSPSCLEEHSCENFSCDGISTGNCNIIYCSEESKIDGESCFDSFNILQP